MGGGAFWCWLITQLNDCLVELSISGVLRLGEGGCSAGAQGPRLNLIFSHLHRLKRDSTGNAFLYFPTNPDALANVFHLNSSVTPQRRTLADGISFRH